MIEIINLTNSPMFIKITKSIAIFLLCIMLLNAFSTTSEASNGKQAQITNKSVSSILNRLHKLIINSGRQKRPAISR
ncbi:hypothetical protein DSM106972_047270 [Dulcicalothrix desertica PCC 7102]|uniref:Uncharacterized protein n=1 Tax=Dulcicalothrix desertica PCC 7102 TaxID=232991 RepID=A0A3S1D5C2_9CYAN|nr:hypothetical protein DSM106972_047270 [Dulcicalothrix desertica PCC 7102]TWH43778.1 hypothetical protein CAL7102_07522 [Dulcicalothrix desertica PCC 7102]